jgi:outer membrane protein TolC
MERVIGKKIGADEILEEPSYPEEVTISIDELRKEMYERRSELRYLKALLESETAEKAAIRGEFLPSVDLILRFRRAGDGIMPDGIDGQNIVDTELSGTVAATWNIFDGFRTTHEVAEQQQIINARENEIRDFEKEIDFQLEASIENHRVSLGKLSEARDAVVQAEENYRITDNQFKAGINTVTDLLDARLFLTRARVQFNTAYYNVGTSLADIERVVEMDLYIPRSQ